MNCARLRRPSRRAGFELVDQLSQVIAVNVHVIALPRLAGTDVSTAVVRDTAVAVRGQEKHLVLERIRTQWPAVAMVGASIIRYTQLYEAHQHSKLNRFEPFPESHEPPILLFVVNA